MKTQEKGGFRTLLQILIPCFVALLFSSASPSKKVLIDLPIHNLVTMCHFGKTIRVDETSVKIHLAHGDGIGRCGQAPPVDQD